MRPGPGAARWSAAWLLLAVAAASVLPPEKASAADELAVVAHADWPGLDAVSLPVLRQLYLGRRTRIAGRSVRCLDLPAGSPPREAWTRVVLGWSERALDRYWLRQALSGGPPPPREVATAAELMALVAREPGTLGYVPWSHLSAGAPPGVRVVAIEERGRTLRPGQPGYPVRQPSP